MENLADIKRGLREWIAEGIPETIKAIKAVLPPNSARLEDVLFIEGLLKEINIKSLRRVISDEELQLAYNRIRESLMELINGLEEADLSDAPPAPAAEEHKARSGNILYRIPEAMQLEKEHKCLVRIAVNEEQLLENIELDQDIRLQSIRISDVMLVQLIDPTEPAPFHIRAVNSAEQFIDEDAFTEWLFYVKPILAGTFPLLLKVAVLELVNGKERQREIVLEETVQIVAEEVPEPEEAPLKTASYQLNLSGAVADDALIYSPQPAPAAKAARRSVVGIVRVLAMIGVISVIGVVVMQNPSFRPSLDADGGLPSKGKPESPAVTVTPPPTTLQPGEDSISPGVTPETPQITDPPPSQPPPDTTARRKPPVVDPLSIKPKNPVTDMIRIRGGTFTMGCELDFDPDCGVNELPPRQVRVRDFSLSAAEITTAQYIVFLNAYGADKVKGGSYKGKPLFSDPIWLERTTSGTWRVLKGMEQLPATKITWYGAREFAVFFQMRLPTEAEWEFAAKGGRTDPGFLYSGSNNLDEAGWYRANSQNRPHAVRMKKANSLGLYDMSGNVWEWTADCKHTSYEGAPADSKAWTAGGDCLRRVLRGGSWAYPSESARATARMDAGMGDALENVGFRVARD